MRLRIMARRSSQRWFIALLLFLAMVLSRQLNLLPSPLTPSAQPAPQEASASATSVAIPEGAGDASSSAQTPAPAASSSTSAQLVRVIDGDTIVVRIGGSTETLRIIGINTPETVDPRRGVECYGREASAFAASFFAPNLDDLILERDPTQGNRDKYGRLLRYVFTEAGTRDYGATAIRLGYAYEYTYQLPYKYRDIYRSAQREAQSSERGLWSQDARCQ